MSIQEQHRPAFERAVIDRMKESGYLEVEIRVECLTRSGDGYHDGSVDAYWHFWNAALDSVVIELPKNDLSVQGEDRWRAKEIALTDCRAAIKAAGLKVKP